LARIVCAAKMCAAVVTAVLPSAGCASSWSATCQASVVAWNCSSQVVTSFICAAVVPG